MDLDAAEKILTKAVDILIGSKEATLAFTIDWTEHSLSAWHTVRLLSGTMRRIAMLTTASDLLRCSPYCAGLWCPVCCQAIVRACPVPPTAQEILAGRRR